MTAALAWATIGERPALHTMLASLAALVGVAVMLGGSFADAISGAALMDGLFGKFLAVFMALGMATMTIIMRKHQDVPMLPAVGLSAWICSAAVFAFAAPLSISANDFWLCAAFGLFQNASGLALYAIGSRRIPAAEATLHRGPGSAFDAALGLARLRRDAGARNLGGWIDRAHRHVRPHLSRDPALRAADGLTCRQGASQF